jgi:hypothetical protein
MSEEYGFVVSLLDLNGTQIATTGGKARALARPGYFVTAVTSFSSAR